MKTRAIVLSLGVIFLGTFLSAILIPDQTSSVALGAPKVTMPRRLVIMGGTAPGGGSDIQARWMYKTVTDAFPEMKVTRLPGAGMEACHKIEIGEVDLAATTTVSAWMAWKGKKPEFEYAHRKMRCLVNYPLPCGGLVCATLPKSGIETIADLKGKKVGMAKRASATHLWVEKGLKEVYGFDYADLEAAGGLVHFGSFKSEAAMMAEGKLDAVLYTTAYPSPPLLQLDLTRGIKIIPLSAKFLQAMSKAVPGVVIQKVPIANYKAYKDQPPMETVTLNTEMIVNKDMSQDVAYALTEAIMRDKGAYLKELRGRIKKFQPDWVLGEQAVQNCFVPFHPGAAKYWEDQGHKVPESQFLKLAK